ncbi:MAG: LacI family DNA-binding transcriptional regulator [Micropruina sp.]|nr:LacI family DNA-binding transcriptional regulator [Micropruina sp.]
MAEERKATIYSVAEHAKVSIATVSRTLTGAGRVSEASRQRVLEAIRTLNYIPDGAARSLAAKRHQALGLVLPELNGYYYPELLTGFESLAAERRRSVVLVVAGLDGRDLTEPLADLCSRVDGVALMNGARLVGADRLAAIRQHTPTVAIGAAPGPGDSVRTGSRDNARRLTTHLLEHGRSRLIFAGSPELAADAASRWQGFCDAMIQHGRAVPEAQPGGFDVASGQALGVRIGTGELTCDAVVCVNDDVALGVYMELRRRSIGVPTDVAITGWDDTPATRYTTPGITTVAQPVRQLGRVAAARLVARIDGLPTDDCTELATTIVLRGSCGCPDTPPYAPRSVVDQKEYR